MFKKIQLFSLLLVHLFAFAINGSTQAIIGAASGKAIINNQLHEWSVGEMCAVTTAVSPVLIVTQGFLQPQETPVSTDETALIFGDLQVMPNPTAAIATLRGTLPAGMGEITFRVLDAKGALVESGKTNAMDDGQVEQALDLTAQSPGTYFLHLQANGAVRTFSIIKL